MRNFWQGGDDFKPHDVIVGYQHVRVGLKDQAVNPVFAAHALQGVTHAVAQEGRDLGQVIWKNWIPAIIVGKPRAAGRFNGMNPVAVVLVYVDAQVFV